MSLHRSLHVAEFTQKQRNVLTRRERILKLMEKRKFDENMSVFGLPKVRTDI